MKIEGEGEGEEGDEYLNGWMVESWWRARTTEGEMDGWMDDGEMRSITCTWYPIPRSAFPLIQLCILEASKNSRG